MRATAIKEISLTPISLKIVVNIEEYLVRRLASIPVQYLSRALWVVHVDHTRFLLNSEELKDTSVHCVVDKVANCMVQF